MILSKRAAAVAESATLRLANEIQRLRDEGKSVVNLLEGEGDLPAPAQVKAAIARALAKNQTRYSSSSGLPELRALLARKLETENGIPVDASGVLVANGGKQAIFESIQAVCGPGDEVLIPAPYWVSFPEAVRLAGAKPVFVAPKGHQLDLDAIGRAVTRRTKLIIINSPNNPTGAVYPEEDLRAVARLAAKKDFLIMSDEAYEELIYDGRRHFSIASIGRDAARRTITINTFSKAYSMTGFRVGYMAADPEITRAVGRIHGHVTGNVCTFVQHAAIAALGLPVAQRRRLREVFQRRRDLAYAETVKTFDCIKPRGAFYLFVDARRHFTSRIKNSAALAERLLRDARVAVVPGSACGMEGHLRISYSGPESETLEGLRRIRAAL
jgi:aspartate aminotransferase